MAEWEARLTRKSRIRMALLIIGAGILYWMLDAFVEAFFLSRGSFVDSLIRPDLHSIWIRFFFVFAVFVFTILYNQRKLVEERLKLFMEAVEEAPDGVQITDLSGHILYSNKAIERIYGYSPEEYYGKHVNEMNVDRDFASKFIIPSIQETGSWSGELMVKHKNGSIFPIYLNASMVRDRRGRPIAMIGVIRDITELKRRRELSDALNEINAAINSTLDFDEIMQRVIVEATKAVHAMSACIALREGDKWVIKYVYGMPKERVGTELTDDKVKISVEAVETKMPVVVNDATKDDRVDPEIMAKFGFRAIMVVPLYVKDEVIGTMAFFRSSSDIPFTEAEVDFAGKLAVSVSLSLQNASLYETEHRVSQTLQEAILTMPQEVPGIEFGYLYRSATGAVKVGGDFYDLFELEHDRVGIVIGDVSGKGLEAATLTSLVKNTIKAYAYQDEDPALVITKTNNVVKDASAPAVFVTVFFGILDTVTGHLAYCSAGHPPAIVKRVSGSTYLLATTSPAIGAFAGVKYTNSDTTLEKGDMLVLYTDGAIEARRGADFFGEERLIELVKGLKPMSTRGLPQLIFNGIIGYTGGKLSDDLALMVVTMKGKR